jgi:hypothetical protein
MMRSILIILSFLMLSSFVMAKKPRVGSKLKCLNSSVKNDGMIIKIVKQHTRSFEAVVTTYWHNEVFSSGSALITQNSNLITLEFIRSYVGPKMVKGSVKMNANNGQDIVAGISYYQTGDGDTPASVYLECENWK